MDVKERLIQLVKLETITMLKVLFWLRFGNSVLIIRYTSFTHNDFQEISMMVPTYPCPLPLPILSAFLE